MAEKKALPHPATSADEYLYDIAMSLRTMTQALGALTATAVTAGPETDEVELREQVKKIATRDAKQAAAKVAGEAVGPVTVETVETVPPSRPVGGTRK